MLTTVECGQKGKMACEDIEPTVRFLALAEVPDSYGFTVTFRIESCTRAPAMKPTAGDSSLSASHNAEWPGATQRLGNNSSRGAKHGLIHGKPGVNAPD